MGENQFLVDTDVLIAYLNHRAYRRYLEAPRSKIYYSAVTKKELLSKRGLRATERKAILTLLRRFGWFVSTQKSQMNIPASDRHFLRLSEETL